MAELMNKHTCDMCNNETYFFRLAEPQSVRVEESDGPYIALAEYAVAHLLSSKVPDDEESELPPGVPAHHSELRVFAADENKNEYQALLYQINKPRTLEEAIFCVGGEYVEEAGQ